METKKKLKSSTPYLFNSYIWLVNTIARGPISRAAIDDKWANASANEYKQDCIPESNFHRWKSTVESLFGITIKCNAYNEYYIEEASDLRGEDLRMRMLNLISINNLLKDSEDLSDQILFEPIPSGERFLTPIIEALRDKSAIEMTYQSFTRQQPSTFIVEPYCLKMFKQRWYLLAYSEGIDKMCIYSLDRVHAIEPTKQKYTLPEDFNAEAYFKNIYGVAGGEEKPEEVKICIDAMQANYLRTLPLHSSQEEIERNDDYSIFRFNIVPSYEFLQELRKYGSDVEVISPESVRAEFTADAECLYGIYKRKESWV